MSASSSSAANDYLVAQKLSFPEVSAVFDDLSSLHSKKLWHQLTDTMLSLLSHPHFNNADRFLQFHSNFISKFQKKINSVSYARISIHASKQYLVDDEAIKFLDTVKDTVKEDVQASLLVKTEIIRRNISKGNVDAVKSSLDECKQAMDGFNGILEEAVHAAYFFACMDYYKKKGPESLYFSNAMLYLTYTPLSEIDEKSQINLASEIGSAALLGKNIYQFGDLLQHPIFKVLQAANEWQWLAQLLSAFNEGNLSQFSSIFPAIKDKNARFRANDEFLQEKIRIMAFMEFVFYRASAERVFTFEEIAKHCALPVKRVEWLVMKSLALKVLKGSIDEVEKKVRITWIQPRILNLNQIKAMRDKLVTWSGEVQVTTTFLEDNSQEILHHNQ